MPSDAGRATWPWRKLLKACLPLSATALARGWSRWQWAWATGPRSGAEAYACGRARKPAGMDEQFEAAMLSRLLRLASETIAIARKPLARA